MSVLRPRNRLVNFRLSEDEFERLRTSCAESGARSISDFARSSVLDRLEEVSAGGASPTLPQLANLDHKVTDLESRVTQLIQLLTTVGRPQEAEVAKAAAAEASDSRSRG